MNPTPETSYAGDAAPEVVAEVTYEAPQTQMPAALVGALLLQLLGGFVVRLVLAGFRRDRILEDFETYREVVTRWALLGRALPFVCLSLALAGALELLRGSIGRARLGAQIIVGAIGVGLAARIGLELHLIEQTAGLGLDFSPELPGGLPGELPGELSTGLLSAISSTFHLFGPSELPLHAGALGAWGLVLIAQAACWPVVTIGLLVCGWRDRTVRWLALPLLATSLVPGAHVVDVELRALFGLTRQGAFALAMMLEIFYVVVFLFALFRCAPIADPFGGWARAARGLDRARRALRLWIGLSLLSVLLLLGFFVIGGSLANRLLELWSFTVPLGLLLAQLGLISGMFGAASLTMLDAPRLRLHFAATPLLLGTAIFALRLACQRAGNAGGESHALPVLVPCLSIVALAFYLTSLRGFGTLLNARRFDDRLSTSIWITLLLLIISLGCELLAADAGSVGTAILCITVGLAAQAFVLHILARLTGAMAEQLRLREKLPPARLRERAKT